LRKHAAFKGKSRGAVGIVDSQILSSLQQIPTAIVTTWDKKVVPAFNSARVPSTFTGGQPGHLVPGVGWRQLPPAQLDQNWKHRGAYLLNNENNLGIDNSNPVKIKPTARAEYL
jgi:hypothetical protein